jgi:hypothetical protein
VTGRRDAVAAALWRRGGPGVLALVLAGTALTGCTSARSSLGTSDNSCYLALPTAAQAIGPHSHGRLVGLNLYTLKYLKERAPKFYADLSTKVPEGQSVCVVAYTGHFTASEVSDPKGHPSGPFAVVVATTAANKVLGTIIFKRVPLHFGHTHLG